MTSSVGPIKAAIGWIEHGSRRDAVEYARGYASKHFDAPAICWYSVLPLLGGWLWEVQEGGPGRSHLAEVAKALSSGAEQSYFRVGNRAYSVSMRDGRPFTVLLPTEESKALFEADVPVLQPRGRMTLVIKRGTGFLVFGTTLFASGALLLGGASGLYALNQHYVPSPRVINLDTLPTRQWSKVGAIPPNLFVESMKLDQGADKWTTVVKPIHQAPASKVVSPSPATPVPGAEQPRATAPLATTAPNPVAPVLGAPDPALTSSSAEARPPSRAETTSSIALPKAPALVPAPPATVSSSTAVKSSDAPKAVSAPVPLTPMIAPSSSVEPPAMPAPIGAPQTTVRK